MPHNVEYYLERGFSQSYAEYFAAGRRKIIAVKPNDDYSIILQFDNGEYRRFDVNSLIAPGTVFEELRDKSVFNRVYLDEDNVVCWDRDPSVDSRVVWSNKLDISPDTCYVEGIAV